MEVLRAAIAAGRRITLQGEGAASVAALLPVERSSGCVALGLEEKRFLRILHGGKVDLNGGRNGPWTEFRVTTDESGAGVVQLQGVKSGLWLRVVDGELASAAQPEQLLPALAELAAQPAEHAEPGAAGGQLARLRLQGGGPSLPWPVRVCPGKSGQVLLVTDLGGNVACGPNGNMHAHGGNGKWAQWQMERAATGGASFKNLGHGRYLAFDAAGRPALADAPAVFELDAGMQAVGPEERMPDVNPQVLSAADVACFKEQGYVVLRRAVPPELVRDALRSINHQLGKPGCWTVDPNPLNAAQLALRLPPDGLGRDVINKSPALWSALNVLLGAGNVLPWARGQQVALRFPQPPERGHDQPDVLKGTRYHIDGMGQNKLCPFTLLCGVALSDQSRPNCGNLHVFPGSHLNKTLHKYYVERIDDDTQNEADDSKPDLGMSTQVLLQPGDVVLAHQLLAHRVGINTSENIRYQLYYRVPHKDHDSFKRRIVENPWIEYAI